MTSFLTELRTTLRALRRSPMFLLSAVACLAIGLGANIAMLSVVDALLLRPLPYPQAQRLVIVREKDAITGDVTWNMTMADFLDIRQQSKSFEYLSACTYRNRTLEGLEEPLRIKVGMITAEYFQMLGLKPHLGRLLFTKEEEEAPHATAAILQHDFWMKRLGGDPAAIGRTLNLDGRSLQVVGVLPARFRPQGELAECEILTPEAISFAGRDNRLMGTFEVMGRLRSGANLDQADREVHTVAARIRAAAGKPRFDAYGLSAPEEVARPYRIWVLPLQAAVALVLLIACLNVASLQLVRNTARVQELAVRRALGARPGQMWRLFLAESLVLGLLGALAGSCISLALQKVMASLVASFLSIHLELGFHFALMGAGLMLGFFTGLLLALMSGLMAGRNHLALVLQEGIRATFSKGQRWLLKALVIGELAMSVILLLGTGLLIRSVINLSRMDPGFQVQGRLMAQIPLPPQRYRSPASQRDFLLRLEPALHGIPGVQEVGVNDTLPLLKGCNTGEASATATGEAVQDSVIHEVTPGYFQALGIPWMEGRAYSPAEKQVCVVNRLLARRLWPDGHPIGRQMFLMHYGMQPWIVTGVCGDTVEQDLRERAHNQVYLSAHDHGLYEGATVVLKVQGDPGRYARIVKDTIRKVDPSLAVLQPRPYLEAFQENGSYATARILSILFLAFGGTALLLAAVGLYGVISQITLQRTREIGLRMSLGARPENVVWMVLRESLLLCGSGLLLGACGGFGLARLLSDQLYGIASPDAYLYATVLGLLGFIAVAASFGPALRAAFMNPARALGVS